MWSSAVLPAQPQLVLLQLEQTAPLTDALGRQSALTRGHSHPFAAAAGPYHSSGGRSGAQSCIAHTVAL